MLEAHAVQRIAQFDVDAQVVAIELELVAGADAAVLGDVERQAGHGAFDVQLPVAVLGGVGPVIDAGRLRNQVGLQGLRKVAHGGLSPEDFGKHER